MTERDIKKNIIKEVIKEHQAHGLEGLAPKLSEYRAQVAWAVLKTIQNKYPDEYFDYFDSSNDRRCYVRHLAFVGVAYNTAKQQNCEYIYKDLDEYLEIANELLEA